MTTPQFPPAVLAALARWQEARRVIMLRSGRRRRDEMWRAEWDAWETGLSALQDALDAADASRDAAMRAAEDEALAVARMPQPHRFGGIL